MDVKILRFHNMIPRSIRWRLPLSYISIALLTVCALGAVLLATLRSYYDQQELNYLTLNAHTISRGFERLVAHGVPLEVIYSQLENFSFLAQVKVRLLDADQELLVETGAPQDYLVSLDFGEVGQPISFSRVSPASGPPPPDLIIGGDTVIVPASETSVTIMGASDLTIGEGSDDLFSLWQIRSLFSQEGEQGSGRRKDGTSPLWNLSANRSLYGFLLNADTDSPQPVSDQRVAVPITTRQNEVLGYLELSEGPAYGMEITIGVARALLGAGAVAALLAGGVGFYWSRRMSAPLLDLTESTTRMAHGDLSARATVTGADEFGLLAKSFNHMAYQVEYTVTVLRSFVADAAHELHTPLTALSADLELAVTDTNAERQINFIQRARTQLKRLESLTTDLLDLSRIETRMTPDEHKTFDLVQLALETSELYASRAEQAGILFNLTVPESRALVSGNESQLRRAMGNLLDNALKFTPENGTITLGIQPQEAQVALWVEDTGSGIPPGDLPQLFSRFHRGRNAAAYPGSGLGLAIIKAIVESHGGNVTVTSDRGGTRFTIQLAAAPAPKSKTHGKAGT
jgi:signal transduction histidine kinase